MDAAVWSRRLAARLLDRLLPPHCLACTEALAASPPLCTACHEELPWNRPACARCALPLAAGEGATLCGRCLRRPPPQTRTWALLRYADPVDRWLGGLKFAGDLAAGRLLGDLLEQAYADDPPWRGLDAVIPLPLHWQRLRERGYNQVLELLRPLQRRHHLPLQTGWLRRVRATAAQSQLSAGARRRNLRGAFAAAPQVAGQRLLLVDDVITTGSSVAEAARTLLRAGAAEVQVLALARVPRPG